MTQLKVWLFGPLEVSVDGEPVTGFDSDKVRAFLAYLAVESDRPHRRQKLAGLLWPDFPENSARTNLRRALSNLRQVIGDRQADPPYLFISRQTIQLNVQSEAWIDVARFNKLHKGQGSQSSSIEQLEEAVDLYRGPFLEGFALPDSAAFEEWQLLTRESLQGSLLRSLRRLATHYERIEQYERAVDYARRQIELEPYQEEAYQQLMRLLLLDGRRSEALAQFELLTEILSEELNVEPSADSVLLHERIQSGELASQPAERRFIRGYELRKLIGSGHFGAVYRAKQPVVERDVAVKIVLPHFANDPNFIRRFEVEAQLIARLEHPYIVPLYDYWREPGGAFLVMRWLRGGSLQDSLQRGPWNPEPAIRVVDQIASALDIAHRQGIVHRDIKPANILLDDEANAYLSDFGVASLISPLSAFEEKYLAVEESSGSLGYLSPESIRNEPVTTATDIYSFGVVLYELLIAQHPFPDCHGRELLDKHLSQPLPSVQALRPDLPMTVDAVIQKATAKDPAARYADARSLANAFRRALLVDAQPWAEPRVEIEIQNPYKGLRPFKEADAADFFGRETLVEYLLTQAEVSNFLAVIGPSGSGKSSVIRAGLVPALRRGALDGSQDWFIVEMTPGSQPLEELETALLRIAINPPESLLGQMREDERGLLRAVRRALPDNESTLYLVVDQFEELFTLVEDEEEREIFLNGLRTAVTEENSPLRLTTSLRADYYDRPLQYAGFGELIRRHTEVVLPLYPEELERAVVGPAERMHLSIEPGLVAQIVTDVSNQPGTLPLLQYALTELFEQRQDNQLSLQTYRAIGGVTGALARRAEEIYGDLDESGQETSRQLFLRLVALSEAGEATRRRVQRSELKVLSSSPLTIDGTPVDIIIDAYGAARLLSFDRDTSTRAPTVEVAHEALLREWQRLRHWINEAGEDLALHRRLRLAAVEWLNADRDDGFLLQGSRLDLFETWASESRMALNPEEKTFLEASIDDRMTKQEAEDARLAKEAALEKRAVNRLRAFVAVLIVAVIIAIGLSFFAFNQSRQARQNEAVAEAEVIARSTQEALAAGEARARATQQVIAEEQARIATARELGSAALRNLEVDPERSILLALAAAEKTYSKDQTLLPEVEDALHLAIQASRKQMSLPGLGPVAFSTDGTLATAGIDDIHLWDAATGQKLNTLVGHTGEIGQLIFSPDGDQLLSTAYDDTVRVWDVTTGEPLNILPTGDVGPLSVALSPDGTLVAASSWAGVVKVWDTRSGDEVVSLPHDETTAGLSFSPDGKHLAVSGWDDDLSLWEVATWQALPPITGHGDDVNDVVYSPDGSRLVTASSDATAKVWDAATGEEISSMFHGGWIVGIDISPDGSRVATAGHDGLAKVWDTDTGRELLTLAGHKAVVWNVAFDPSGNYLATGSGDGTTAIWDISPAGHHRDWRTLVGHDDMVFSLAYSPDGSRLATASWDGTAKVWEVETGEELFSLIGHHDQLARIVYSPDGSRLATGSYDGSAKIWDAASGEELLTLEPGAGYVWGIDFSPDGEHIVTGSLDGALQIWEVDNGRKIQTLAGHDDGVFRINYNPDGTRLVSSGWDNVAKVWDVATGEELFTLADHAESVNQSIFSPDGSRLATAGADGKIMIWDAATGRHLQTLSGHTDVVWDVEYSPDGQTLASVGFDGTTRLWDAATGERLLTMSSDMTSPDVAFSPDGNYLAAGNEDALARIYVLPVEELMALARSRLTRSMTTEECQQYLHIEDCPLQDPG